MSNYCKSSRIFVALGVGVLMATIGVGNGIAVLLVAFGVIESIEWAANRIADKL